MAAARELPYHTAQSSAGAGMFNTAAGQLQRQLHRGEYDMFRHAPIFESDFVQVTKRGEVIDVHNRVRMVTVAVASTSPALPMPDVMLLARPAAGLEDPAGRAQARGKGRKGTKALELTRLLPLKFVRLSIHEREKQQLRLKFATGRSCYLQLCPPPGARDNLFAYWERLTYLLRPPLDSRSSTYALPAGELLGAPALDEEENCAGEAEGPGRGEQDQVSVRSLHGAPEVAGATSAAFSGGESIPQNAPKPIHVHYVSTSDASRAELSQDAAAGPVTEAAGEALAQLGWATVGAAEGPGGGRSSTAATAAARTALEGPNTAQPQAGATSQPLEAGVRAVTTGPEPAGQAIGEAARGPGRAGEGCDLSTLPEEEPGHDGEGRQCGPQGAVSHQGRRERREQREKERALRGRHRRADSRHKAADKAPRKLPGGRPVPARRAPRDEWKERGLGGGRRGLGHAPTAKESRASHKSARSVSTASSGSTARRLGRVSNLLRSVKASLSPRAAASPGGRDEDLRPAAGGLSAEAVVTGARTQQGPQAVGSAAPKDRDTAAVEAHS